jgi:hypothetical protein
MIRGLPLAVCGWAHSGRYTSHRVVNRGSQLVAALRCEFLQMASITNARLARANCERRTENGEPSPYQHAIAVAEEPIPGRDRLPIGLQNKFPAGERSH